MIISLSHSLPEGYPWVAGAWSAVGFSSGYLLGRWHGRGKKTKERDCE